MKNSYTRRTFLSTGAVALTGAALGIPGRMLTASELHSTNAVSGFFPEEIDPGALHVIARQGIDAAIAAGATYADIRISDRQLLKLSTYKSDSIPTGDLGFDQSYGIRVCVDGVWGFGFGANPSVEGVVQSAKTAVANVTKLPGTLKRPLPPQVRVPKVMGEWSTPVVIDPFQIAPDEHVAMLATIGNVVERVMGVRAYHLYLEWQRDTRVFASSEGSSTTQVLRRATPNIFTSIDTEGPDVLRETGGGAWKMSDIFEPTSAGFEVVLGAALQDKLKAWAEEAVRWGQLPTTRLPIGRYDAVLDGASTGALLSRSLLPMLSLEYVLDNNDGAISSFSSHISLTSDRRAPRLGAARWDDEGVETITAPVVEHGKIVNYFGTRREFGELHHFSTIGKPETLLGSGVSELATQLPYGRATFVRMHPGGSSGTSGNIDDLALGIGKGILARGGGWISMPSPLGGFFRPQSLYEIQGGRVTARILGAAIQFSSTKLWNSITGIGSGATMASQLTTHWDPEASTLSYFHTHAPAIQVPRTDLLDISVYQANMDT